VARRVEALGGRPVQVLRGPQLLAVRVPRSDAAALSHRLARIPGVRFVEQNRDSMRTTDYVQSVPSDPLWPSQWGPAVIGAPAAWAVTMGSPKVVIAVLDTGVDLSQPDLRGALVPGYNFVSGDNEPSDDNGHGTRTAGIVGARSDNDLGISGVCPRCSIMPVKVSGANGYASWLNVAAGITWAADHGASVISLSLGGGPSDAVAAAISYAERKGILVVAAAGNNGSSQPFYPAADPGVLSVAGTQRSGELYSWSNYGSWVSVAAPGCDTTTFMGGSFGQFCGTSASAPVVAGLAGLALSYSPTSSPDTIERAIVSSAHPIPGVSAGRVDAVGTLAALGATFRTEARTRTRRSSKASSNARSTAKHVQSVQHSRLNRGLGVHWHLRLAAVGGRVAATLHSSKAQSCVVSLRTPGGIWLSTSRGTVDSLVARVARGTYRLDVQCKLRLQRRASLAVRGARFARHERRSGNRRRTAPVPVEIGFKPV
jgi:subtilisin family serine protease